jgi:hypothetical protein
MGLFLSLKANFQKVRRWKNHWRCCRNSIIKEKYMLNKIQNWLMNVAARWLWVAIMLPFRIILGLCYAVSKHMPEKVELPYKIVKNDSKKQGWL